MAGSASRRRASRQHLLTIHELHKFFAFLVRIPFKPMVQNRWGHVMWETEMAERQTE
jgi:hypothetical protein